MRHGKGHILLVIEHSSQSCDCPAGNNLADEHNATLDQGSVPALHVKTEVNFFEAGMKREGHPEDFGIQEAESDQAEECVSIPQVQFRPGGENL